MRKKLLYFAVLFVICCSFYACDQEETPLFAEEPGVYFAQSTYSYSFKDQIGVEKDTILCTVKIFGDSTDYDRTVKVQVVEGDTAHVTTANPERYRILSGVVPAGKFMGSVALEVNDGEELADSVYTVFLEIVPNPDFPRLVEFQGSMLKLQITAKQIPPANWSWLSMYFGEYEDEWWEYICTQTQKTSLPYWPNQTDTETWWMTDQEFLANVAVVKAALRGDNQEHPDKPLSYKNGKPWTIRNY